MSKSEGYLLRTTLASSLQAVVGQETTVELRDCSLVVGRVEHVDGHMNIIMRNATLIDRHGQPKLGCHDQVYIIGYRIRQVHLPRDLDVLAYVEQFHKSLANVEGTRREPKCDRYAYLRDPNLTEEERQLAAAAAEPDTAEKRRERNLAAAAMRRIDEQRRENIVVTAQLTNSEAAIDLLLGSV